MLTTPTPIDERTTGESPDYTRHNLVHTCEPRLIAEFMEIRTEHAALKSRAAIGLKAEPDRADKARSTFQTPPFLSNAFTHESTRSGRRSLVIQI